MADASDIDGLTFEQALAELERIVGQLESGQAPLRLPLSFTSAARG